MKHHPSPYCKMNLDCFCSEDSMYKLSTSLTPPRTSLSSPYYDQYTHPVSLSHSTSFTAHLPRFPSQHVCTTSSPSWRCERSRWQEQQSIGNAPWTSSTSYMNTSPQSNIERQFPHNSFELNNDYKNNGNYHSTKYFLKFYTALK